MIINISGTGGAGKSTLVRRIMELYDTKEPVFVEGRLQPLYYKFEMEWDQRKLAVPGHYETVCGGCDTLAKYTPTLDFIYDLVRKLHDTGRDVVYEGMMIESDVNRVVAAHNDGYPINVLSINIPLAECLESINIRRRKKNPNAEPVNPKATTGRWKSIQRRIPRLTAAGVPAEFLSREDCYEKACKLLGIWDKELNERWNP